MGKAIGIDLGTTNSVAAWEAGGIEILRLDGDFGDLFRSAVQISEAEEVVTGRAAFGNMKNDLHNTVLSVKRLMGVSLKDDNVVKMIAETKETRGYIKYSIGKSSIGTEESIAITLHGKEYSPEEISAIILKEIKRIAEIRLGEVTHAVITVPAYFSERQKAATKKAAEMAGFVVQRLLAEPTAAALAYGLDKLASGEARTLLVYDFGGGTFDLSVLSILNGQVQEMGTSGNPWLGGDDVDKQLATMVYAKMCMSYGIDIGEVDGLIEALPQRERWSFLSDFRAKIENLKFEIGIYENAQFILGDTLKDSDGDFLDINVKLTRDEFEQVLRRTIQKTISQIEKLLKEIDYDETMIDSILLVGGSSQIPLVGKMLAERFGTHKILADIDPMRAVAQGAAALARSLENNEADMVMASVTRNMYMEVKDADGSSVDVQIMEKNMPLPYTTEHEFKTTTKNQRILRVLTKSEDHEGGMEIADIVYTTVRKGLSAGSGLLFKFTLDESGVLHVVAHPTGYASEKKEFSIGRSGPDSKAYGEITRVLADASTYDVTKEDLEDFISKIADGLEATKGASDTDAIWKKLSYEAGEHLSALRRKVDSGSETDLTQGCEAMLAVYPQLISSADKQIMLEQIVIARSGDSSERVNAQAVLDEVTDRYLHVYSLFRLRGAVEQVDDGSAERLLEAHDGCLRHFAANRVEAAIGELIKGLELMKRLGIKGGGTDVVGTSIGKR